ncbi:hypothetical protein K402DRAFT_20791 [Aulographum hederae CBS 113979]|uniref:Uncharacterized protein n=1 Tax=Aulographum hederae CBS 113979 TaxID=1176131 RepID=A0A6G1H6I3_9PEZI|nr:hypothetical protein K402DRAFT_20791 [Aulographum hederae CBS 113979]
MPNPTTHCSPCSNIPSSHSHSSHPFLTALLYSQDTVLLPRTHSPSLTTLPQSPSLLHLQRAQQTQTQPVSPRPTSSPRPPFFSPPSQSPGQSHYYRYFSELPTSTRPQISPLVRTPQPTPPMRLATNTPAPSYPPFLSALPACPRPEARSRACSGNCSSPQPSLARGITDCPTWRECRLPQVRPRRSRRYRVSSRRRWIGRMWMFRRGMLLRVCAGNLGKRWRCGFR